MTLVFRQGSGDNWGTSNIQTFDKYFITLNGREQKHVLGCNTETGAVFRYQLDQYGNPKYDRRGRLMREICIGKVMMWDPETIELMGRAGIDGAKAGEVMRGTILAAGAMAKDLSFTAESLEKAVAMFEFKKGILDDMEMMHNLRNYGGLDDADSG